MAAYAFASISDCLNAHMKKDSYSLAQNTGGIGEPSRCWSLFLPGSEVQIFGR